MNVGKCFGKIDTTSVIILIRENMRKFLNVTSVIYMIKKNWQPTVKNGAMTKLSIDFSLTSYFFYIKRIWYVGST